MAKKLRNTTDRCEVLEKERQAEQEGLKKAAAESKNAQSALRAAKEELSQDGAIAAGKPFLLRRKYTDPKYAQLDKLWSLEDAYLDLAASATDAAEHFRDQKDRKMENVFWSQFHNPERPLPLTDRLAEWAELNRLSGLAMKDVVSLLWPKRPEPKSYFGLVQQFLDAVPYIEAMKRSACIEGARMALARVKTYWA